MSTVWRNVVRALAGHTAALRLVAGRLQVVTSVSNRVAVTILTLSSIVVMVSCARRSASFEFPHYLPGRLVVEFFDHVFDADLTAAGPVVSPYILSLYFGLALAATTSWLAVTAEQNRQRDFLSTLSERVLRHILWSLMPAAALAVLASSLTRDYDLVRSILSVQFPTLVWYQAMLYFKFRSSSTSLPASR